MIVTSSTNLSNQRLTSTTSITVITAYFEPVSLTVIIDGNTTDGTVIPDNLTS